MRANNFGLQNNIVSIYDPTKTTVFGRAFQKLINSQQVIGPPLTNFIDTQTQLGIIPSMIDLTDNGRLFIASAPTTGQMVISLYTFDIAGQIAPSPVGKIIVNVPNLAATTHTLRYFKVWDGPNVGTVTGWKINFGTVGSVLINGGSFTVNNLAQSDFVMTSFPVIGMAISDNAKAVYFTQEPANIGVNHNLTANVGSIFDYENQVIYAFNGTFLAGTIHKLNIAANLTVATQTTTAPTVSASPTFTLANHGYNANDQVVMTSNIPTPFVQTTAIAQTVYFVRNPTQNTFELSATSGGVSINATSVVSNTVFLRAFGICTNQWIGVKTGTILGLLGTVVANSVKYAVPNKAIDPNISSTLDGQQCGFMCSSTNLYLFKLSDVVNGATTLPSMDTRNIVGNGLDYTAIAPVYATFSTYCAQAIYASNTAIFYTKNWQNNVMSQRFGGLNTDYLELKNPATCNFGFVAISSVETTLGWFLAASTTAGQRGVYFMDLRSDQLYGYSYATSPVMYVDGSQAKFLSTIEQLFDYTNSAKFSIRSAATAGDALFSSPTGGWSVIQTASDLTSLSLNKYVQIKIEWYIAALFVNTPAQVGEIIWGLNRLSELSEYWSASHGNTSPDGASPAYVAFRQQTQYGTLPTKFVVRGIDDLGNIAYQFDTVASPGLFSRSANNGTSWNAWTNMAAFPNVINTTELRVNVASPSGSRITWSIQEG